MSLFLSPDSRHEEDDDRTLLLSDRAAPGTQHSSRAPSLELNNLQPSSEHHSSDQAPGNVGALGEGLQAQKLAQDVRISLDQLKNDLEAEREQKKRDEIESDARDRRLRSHWFP